MFEVDQTWLAVLMTVCCVPSVAAWLRLRLREFQDAYGTPRAAPARFLGSCVDGLMMGLGTGLAATSAVVAVSMAFLVVTG